MTKVRTGPDCASIGLAQDAFVGGRCGTVVLRRGGQCLDLRHDRPVLSLRRLQQPCRGRVAPTDQRPQAGILGLVVRVQTVHKPDDLVRHRLPATALRHPRRREHQPDLRQVTAERPCTIPIIRVSAGDSAVIIATFCGMRLNATVTCDRPDMTAQGGRTARGPSGPPPGSSGDASLARPTELRLG
jgi:hypothetical protein